MMLSKLTGAGAVFVFAALLVGAQPPAPRPVAPPPRAVVSRLNHLFDSLGDPRLQTELALNAEQREALLAVRQRWWDSWYETAPREHIARQAANDRLTAIAIGDVLTPEQRTRAEQLALQRVWRHGPLAVGRSLDATRVSSRVLTEYPDLIDALRLTADQKSLVGAKSAVNILLTPEQSETARRLLGTPRPEWLVAGDPRQTEVQLYGYNDTLSLARVVAHYRADLKLTAEQFAAVPRPKTGFGTRFDDTITPAEALKRAQDEDAASEKVLAKVLTPDQLTRVKQIVVRLRHDPPLGSTNSPLVVNLANELGATPAQHKAFEAARAAHQKAVARAALLDDPVTAFKDIRAADAALEKDLTDALAADQRAKLNALAGPPLAARHAKIGGATPPTREQSFGRYTSELQLLGANKSVQTELKLTADQIDLTKKRWLEFNKQFGSGFGAKKQPDRNPEEKATAETKFVADALAVILDPAQAKRFREIMIQHRDRSTAGVTGGLPSGLAYPGVADELKLTPEQRGRLFEGEHPLDLLTAAQWKQFRTLFGARFTGDYKTTPEPKSKLPSFRLAEDRSRAEFLKSAPMDALELTPAQHTRLVEAVNRYQLKTVEAKSGLGQPKSANNDEAVAAFNRELARISTPKPFLARLDQLDYQKHAAQNLCDTFARADVTAALKLTPTQLGRMADLEAEAEEVAARAWRSPLAHPNRLEVAHQIRDRLDAHVLTLLTPEQAAKWKELTGEPYPNFTKPVFRGHSPRFRD